ncbi:hypothetical protein CLAIMM_03108 [Cladophialophora immunda]|nr:hypothetical protein CLAIMM_03108 [Cladophialophora immunda]
MCYTHGYPADVLSHDFTGSESAVETNTITDQDQGVYDITDHAGLPPVSAPSGTPKLHGPKSEYWYCCFCENGPMLAKHNTHCSSCHRKRCASCHVEWR